MFRNALTRTLFVLFAFIAFSPTVSVAFEEKIASVQRRLSELGFEPGPVDGLMGPRTRKAVSAFQRANSLSADGQLGAKTLNALFPAQSTNQTTKAVGTLLSYEALGWQAPQSGANALSRFRRQTGSLDMKRSTRELIVPDGDGIFLIAPGDALPGFDCNPVSGRIEMEFMLGLKGPVVFRPLDNKGYCKLGFGILLQVGQRLRMAAAVWEGGQLPEGVVEIGKKGLVYVDSSK